MYSYFFYLLKKNVDTFLIDQLGRKTFPLLADDDNSEEDEEAQPGFKAPPVELWVLGQDCYPPYDHLTVQERQLIKWRYVDSMKSSEIAQVITEHPNTVRDHISKVKLKIKDAIIENNMEDLVSIFKLED